ncbi:TonB-dependent receptor, partial [Sphingomonas bacterium]|uniref:TonB-dependent receptor n=1 Tax=Sphingomonas bacterium TaxID=1895847 RepID=UPI001C2DC408
LRPSPRMASIISCRCTDNTSQAVVAGGFYLKQRSKLCVLEFSQNPGEALPTTCTTLQPSTNIFDIAFQTASTQSRESWSSYGQATYKLLDGLRLTAGARYTQDTVSAVVSNYFNFYGPSTSAGLKSRAVTGKVIVGRRPEPAQLGLRDRLARVQAGRQQSLADADPGAGDLPARARDGV